MSKTRSAKGELVDFDLLKIKQQLATNPVPVNVQEREQFIDRKHRRKNKRNKTDLSKLLAKMSEQYTMSESESEPEAELDQYSEENTDQSQPVVTDAVNVKQPKPPRIPTK